MYRPPKQEARARVSADTLVSFAPMEDLGIDTKFMMPTQVRPLDMVAGSYTYFAEGDVLVAKITPCFENGKLGIARGLRQGIGFGSSEFHVLRPGPMVDSEFLYYFLLRDSFRTEGKAQMGGAVGQQRVPREFIESYSIPLPPLPEQHRIVALLDEAFAGIAKARENTERNLENAREVFQRRLQDVFSVGSSGWQRLRLQEVASDFGRGRSRHRPRNDPSLFGGPYPFVQTGEVRGADHWITSYSQCYNDEGLAQSKLWPKGTVCITIAANIAETGILAFDACFPDSVIGLVPDERLANAEFLEYLLQDSRLALQRQGKGSAQDNINLGTFETQTFPIPTIQEQESVVLTLNELREATRHLESIYHRKLAALDALKQSLLHQAFHGDL